jgi:hypothetical protein
MALATTQGPVAVRPVDATLAELARLFAEARELLEAAEARAPQGDSGAEALAAVVGLENLLTRSTALVECLAASDECTASERSDMAGRATDLLARLERLRDEVRRSAEALQLAHANVTALRSLAGSAAGERAGMCIDA